MYPYKCLQGSHAGYNFQSVVDEKQGLILSTDVVSENNDLNQFACQINKANEVLGKKCKVAGADSGFASTDELEKIDKQGIKVIVPSQRQASKLEPHEFAKERFTYDSQNDDYLCSQGHQLTLYYLSKKEKVELSFGHIKRNLKVDSFLLRGLKGVKAEASILASCFNLVRMINLLGVPALVKELRI